MIGRRLLSALAASSLTLPLLAGCGGGEPSAASTGTVPSTVRATEEAADLALARAALLRLDDLPFDWAATPQNGQAPATCAAVQRLRARPRAVSPGFVRGDGGIVHTVTIFRTAADADRIFTALAGRANTSCNARSIVAGWRARAAADVELGDMIVSRLDAEPLAARIEATRFTLPVRVGGVRTRLFEDYVRARVGRGISIVWLRSRFVRPSDRLRMRLTAIAVRRLRAALER